MISKRFSAYSAVGRHAVLTKGDGHACGLHRRAASRAFTLIELLVVVSVIALLIAILLPSLQRARMQARIVRVHADLHQICVALESYMMDNRNRVPPTRCGCGTDVNFQLPVELAVSRYLPKKSASIPQADFPDFFDPTRTYRYRAPGPLWLNGSFFDAPNPRAFIWVPDDFPRCQSDEGQYEYARNDDPPSAVTFAVWSIGPDARCRKFPRVDGSDDVDATRFPLPRRYWLKNSGDTGLITHFRDRHGVNHASP
jgi:prepilin-type N-terminal cleavage/methylation domain-containing protein